MTDVAERGGLARYKEISDRLVSQIDAKVFLPNDRLPSVRELMQFESISLNTASRVFQELQARGRIYSRDRSGYFVLPGSTESKHCSQSSPVPATPDDVAPAPAKDGVMSLLADNAEKDVMALGCAVLDDSLVPLSLLNRTLLSIAKDGNTNHGREIALPGLLELRCGIARLMADRGVICGPDDIIITAGDGVAMDLALRAVTCPGDLVAVETPTYFGILQALQAANLQPVAIPTDGERGIDLNHLELAIRTQRISCVVLNPTLQNPSGYTMPHEQRERVCAVLAREGIPLIEDDVFYDLHPEAGSLKAIKSYDRQGRVVYFSSFTKVVAPGYRIGWCVPGRYRQKILSDILERNITISSLAQLTLSRFIRKGYYAQNIKALQQTFALHRHKVASIVQRYFPPGTRVSHPAGGFVFWFTAPYPLDASLLQQSALAKGIAISPGSLFYASPGAEATFRICIGRRWTAEVDRALICIGALCGELA